MISIFSHSWSKRALIVVLVLLLLLLGAMTVDLPVLAALSNWPPQERAFFGWLTRWGMSDWILFPSFVIGLLFSVMALLLPVKRTWVWMNKSIGIVSWYIFLGVGIPGLVVVVVKRLVGRARPSTPEIPDALLFQPFNWGWQWHSFASGHTTTSFAFAVVLTSLFGARSGFLWFGLAALIGLSRVVTTAHFPTDVIGGALIGTLVGLAVQNFFERRNFPIRRRGKLIENRAGAQITRGLRSLLRR